MESNEKRHFNKRAFFQKKFKKNFGSQQEGHGRAFLQKKAFVRQYYKDKRYQEKKGKALVKPQDEVQEDFPAMHPTELPELRRALPDKKPSKLTELNPTVSTEAATEDAGDELRQSRKSKSSWKRARLQYHQKHEERIKKKETIRLRRQEIEEAKVKRKGERLKRYIKLNQRNKKGQPIMRGRVELMLEKLEKELG